MRKISHITQVCTIGLCILLFNPKDVQASFTFTASIEFGDVNADRNIDKADKELVEQHIQASADKEVASQHPGWILKSYAAMAADTNQDGIIDNEDLEYITSIVELTEKREQIIDVKTEITKEYKRGTNFSLGAKANGKLTYKSSNANVVTVSAKGVANIQGYGTAVITITAAETDTYKSAVKKVTVNIVPSKRTLNVSASGSGAIKITWNKDITVDGYQIQCSTKKTFPVSETMTGTVSKNSTVSNTLRNLSKGKRYYVRIRGFKRINGIPIYGVWSAVKNVVVK